MMANEEGICYAAACSGSFAEVDVFVTQEKRGSGIGRRLVDSFCHGLSIVNLHPLWDCYANNIASARLAEIAGFIEKFEYNFYNLEAL